jgi:hypothetical protein
MVTDYLRDDARALEVMIEGIHKARTNHRILSTFATRTDSAMLACAAMEAIQAAGLSIVWQPDA